MLENKKMQFKTKSKNAKKNHQIRNPHCNGKGPWKTSDKKRCSNPLGTSRQGAAHWRRYAFPGTVTPSEPNPNIRESIRDAIWNNVREIIYSYVHNIVRDSVRGIFRHYRENVREIIHEVIS